VTTDEVVVVSAAAEAAVREASKDADKTTEVRVHEDETKETKTPGFSRMRTDWQGPDAAQVHALKSIVDGRILTLYADAFVIMNEVYDLVREPEVDEETGEYRLDNHGFPIWRRHPSGAFVEDFTVLTQGQKEDLLFRITTRLFEWKQTSADLWGEAMFAKAQWEEAMAIGFDTPPGKLTVDDRTQKGRLASREERYFAIFLSLISRRADAVTGSMELLAQRLKDALSF
jgi:hypothetical protein